MAEAFIVRRGGGGSGGTLVVTSSGAGTVTVSNSALGKSYSKTVTAGGSVTFKGLKTGTWTVTLSNGTQTTTTTVTINADYSTSIAYFSATISVTYPAGSTCAITTDPTNYSDIIFAGDTSGHWSFTVPYAGTWYVASYIGDISNPDKITFKTVNITADGQSSSVTLSYELMLYDRGNQYTAVTGGWKLAYKKHGGSSGTGTVSFEASSATITPASYTSTSMATVNKIDLTDVKTLKVTLDRYDDNAAAVVVNSNKQNPDLNYDSGDYTAYKSIPSGGTSSTSKYSGTVSLDVSSLSGSYYIVIGSRGGDAGSGKIVVYKVWGDPN